MESNREEVVLFGIEDCNKTKHYRDFLTEKGVKFTFLDVHEDEAAADELRSLYTTGKLNFPTLLIKDKKLRNPYDDELSKWLKKKKLHNYQTKLNRDK